MKDLVARLYQKYCVGEPAEVIRVVSLEKTINIIESELTMDFRFIPLDAKYKLTSRKEVERFLQIDQMNLEKFVKDFHDCDDFAVRLWGRSKMWTRGLAFGYIHTIEPIHAMNFFIDDNEQMWGINPQNDSIIGFSEASLLNKKLKNNISLMIL